MYVYFHIVVSGYFQSVQLKVYLNTCGLVVHRPSKFCCSVNLYENIDEANCDLRRFLLIYLAHGTVHVYSDIIQNESLYCVAVCTNFM